MKNLENWKVGSVINPIIHKADGSIIDLGYIHNVLGTVVFSIVRLGPSNAGSLRFVALSSNPLSLSGSRGTVNLPGTFRYNGTTGRIERVTGPYNMTTAVDGTIAFDLFVFATGEKGYVTSNQTFSSVNVIMKHGTTNVPATSCVKYRTGQSGFGRAVSFGATGKAAQQTELTNGNTLSYSNGVVSYTCNPISFPVVSTPYILDCITASMPHGSYGGSGTGAFYDIEEPTLMEAGDSLMINNFEYRATWDSYTPRPVTGNPLSGTPFNYSYLRLLRATQDEAAISSPNRIWLITEANQYSVPATMLGPSDSLITQSNLTIDQTIAGTINEDDPSSSNFATATATTFGALTATNTYKQIAWGTVSQVHGIVTFDDPQLIEAGKVIHIGQWVRFETDLV